MPRLFVIPQDYRLGHTRRESYRWPMRPVRSLLIYAGGVFLGGALLAPWLAWGVQSLAAHFPVFQKLADQPFHVYVNRSLLVLALLEEVLFRGAIFGALRKTFRWPAAMVISSTIYALVHFFSKPPSPVQIHFTSGLAVLPTMLGGFVDLEKVVPGFFNLTLAG